MDALYYPALSLPAHSWVNPALLFFDRLCVVAPLEGSTDLFDRRTRELMDLNMVRPVTPNGVWGADEDDKFTAFVMGKASGQISSGEFSRLHAGKLAYTPGVKNLISARLLTSVDDEWFEGPSWVVADVMTYLATQTSMYSEEALPLITGDQGASTTMFGAIDTANVPRSVQAVSRLLRVPPNARPNDLRRFRERHREALEAFRAYLTELLALDPDDRGFKARLDEAERARDYLVNETKGFRWRDEGPTIALSAAATVAAFYEGGYASAGVGLLGAVYCGARAMHHSARSRRSGSDPLAYATYAVNRWPPNARNTLS